MIDTAFAGLDPCVHCGFCLQSCPTFLVTGDEADSPRGRIVLMQALSRGGVEPDDEHLRLHLDRCLGCRACEPVCPSGVAYGPALEHARYVLGRSRAPTASARLVLFVMKERAARVPLLRVAQFLRPAARLLAGRSAPGFALGMLAATSPPPWGRRATSAAPLQSTAGTTAAVFRGCIMSGLFRHVHHATERTLAVNGYRPVRALGWDCCGALHAHAGLHDTAVELARRNVRAFERHPSDRIVVNSAGCGAQLRAYGRLLAGDPAEQGAQRLAHCVRDVSEALVEAGPRPGGGLSWKVAYDPPCHLQHAQRIDDAPRSLLGAIPGLHHVEHREPSVCCGGAGIYTLEQREMSDAVLRRKVDALLAARPDAVATGNPGCVMQIGAGLRAAGSGIPVVHPVELLDHSYAEAGLYG